MATTGSISLPIGNVGETTGFTQGQAPTSNVDGSTDKDMFLKLLVAQMKYQDPSKPADSTQMLSQMAQFTQVEKMDQLVDAYTNELQATELTSATGMLGNTVTWTANDKTQTGVVTGVSITNGTPTLLVGSQEVALSTVSKVEKGTVSASSNVSAASTETSDPTAPTTGSTVPATGSTVPGVGTGVGSAIPPTGATGSGSAGSSSSPSVVGGMYTSGAGVDPASYA